MGHKQRRGSGTYSSHDSHVGTIRVATNCERQTARSTLYRQEETMAILLCFFMLTLFVHNVASVLISNDSNDS